MDAVQFALIGVAVGAIYCVYAHYFRDRIRKRLRLRQRVAILLWSAAKHSKE